MALNHQQMTELRDRVLAIIAEHEKESHAPGDVCWDERCNVIGWLCHSLGVESLELIMRVSVIAGEYRRNHEHAHLDNPAATFTDITQ